MLVIKSLTYSNNYKEYVIYSNTQKYKKHHHVIPLNNYIYHISTSYSKQNSAALSYPGRRPCNSLAADYSRASYQEPWACHVGGGMILNNVMSKEVTNCISQPTFEK